MRMIGAVVVLSILVSIAAASGDFWTESGRVATWGSSASDPIVVEMTSESQQSGGLDKTIWWSIEQPAGTVQATIAAPYTNPKVKMHPKATLARASVDELAIRLAELAKQKMKQRDRWKALETELGIVGLESQRCPKEVRVKVGTKRLMLWSGKTGHDLGSSVIKNTSCGDIGYSTGGDGGGVRADAPDLRPRCFAHAGGYLVRVRLHHGCEGDFYEDRFAYVAAP
jgi:hypothetical protein